MFPEIRIVQRYAEIYMHHVCTYKQVCLYMHIIAHKSLGSEFTGEPTARSKAPKSMPMRECASTTWTSDTNVGQPGQSKYQPG